MIEESVNDVSDCIVMPDNGGAEGIALSVCLSVCSVPVPNFGMEICRKFKFCTQVPHHKCNPLRYFVVRTSKVKQTRPKNAVAPSAA